MLGRLPLQVLPIAAKRVLNFDTDLRSGLALYAALVSHWPELARLGLKLKTAPTEEGHFRENAAIVVKLVETLQLPYTLQVCRPCTLHAWECCGLPPCLDSAAFRGCAGMHSSVVLAVCDDLAPLLSAFRQQASPEWLQLDQQLDSCALPSA